MNLLKLGIMTLLVDLPDGLGIQVEFLLQLKKVFHDRTMISN